VAGKPDTLDLALPGAILEYGQAIVEAQGGIRHRTPPAGGPAERIAVEESLLAMVKGDMLARKHIGIKLARQDEGERRLRLRAFAFLANKMLREPLHSNADLPEGAVAALDPSLPPGEALIAARHGIGRLVADGVLDTYPDSRFPWNPHVLLPARALQWVAGGRLSLGIMSPRMLAAARLKGNGEAGADESEGAGDDAIVPAPLSARQIKERIAKRVVGLDGGQLDEVSSRIALHMVRARMLAAGDDPGTSNEICLILGEPGTGKSFLCDVAGQVTGLPYASANAAEMSASGYVGISCEDGLRPLLIAAKGRVESCRFGLMCYDEFTKRGGFVNESSVNSTSVQVEMLRLLQGQLTQVGGKRSNNESSFWINTYGMFFFLCGHAPGLELLIQKRMGRSVIGFGSKGGRRGDRSLLLDALEDYQIIPEILNRLTSILIIPPPRLKDLVKAANAENGTIASYSRLLKDAMLFFEEGAVLAMARHCLTTKSYYRGLAAITSAVAAEAVMRERKGGLAITTADVRRAIGRMDDGVAGMLGALERGRPADQLDDDGTGSDTESNEAEG
jgi:ATP-dependent Clp protease ATP-binding subunit ClpX